MGANPSNEEAIDQIVGLLRQSHSILFITGAGVSADSGLPTYRGIGGLYNVKTTDEGLPIEDALAGETILERPDLTWKYLAQIEQACRRATFNRAHEVIALIESHFERVWTLTQNVDGFHHRAGARNVIDIHGDLHHLCCMDCSFWQAVDDYSHLSFPPHCPRCNGILRPDVVLFGELLPKEKLHVLYRELYEGFDLIFSVGTTSLFPYIAEPVRLGVQRGVPTVEINPDTTCVSPLVDVRLSMRAASALNAIWQSYQEKEPESDPQEG